MNITNTLDSIICWCNLNEGFVSATLSMATIFISVVAIVVSIKAALLPYKQSLKIVYYMEDNEDGLPEIFLTLMNIGNSPIGLNYISVEQRAMQGLPLGGLGDEDYPLKASERMIAPNSLAEYSVVLNEYDSKCEEYGFKIRVVTTKKTYKVKGDWGRG